MNWPIYIEDGGIPFSFCPGKATWDQELTDVYRMMALSSETGDLHLVAGGIVDQPDWWVENMAWFLPRYKQAKFFGLVRAITGDAKALKAVKSAVGGQQGARQRGGNNR